MSCCRPRSTPPNRYGRRWYWSCPKPWDCRFVAVPERPLRRRAIRRRYRYPHTARRLVYGQKHYCHAVWRSAQKRCVQTNRASTNPRMADAGRPARQNPYRGSPSGMSSGLRIRSPPDPDYDPSGPTRPPLSSHGRGRSHHYAATRPQQWPPNTVGRYRNTDPALVSHLIRLLLLRRSAKDYLSFPQAALLDKSASAPCGSKPIRSAIFLGAGCEATWPRLGVARQSLSSRRRSERRNGLPEGYAKFVRYAGTGVVADKRPIYGGFFWINGLVSIPLREILLHGGAGGQTTMIVPSHDLVVVRLGHYKGESVRSYSFSKSACTG